MSISTRPKVLIRITSFLLMPTHLLYSQLIFAVAVVRGEAIVGHVPKKISVCSLYLTLGRLDRLLSNRIQTLLWGFSTRPSLLLSISNCSVLLMLESTFLTFERSKFLTESSNFRILEFYAKYAKFCTIRKFPAIHC